MDNRYFCNGRLQMVTALYNLTVLYGIPTSYFEGSEMVWEMTLTRDDPYKMTLTKRWSCQKTLLRGASTRTLNLDTLASIQYFSSTVPIPKSLLLFRILSFLHCPDESG